MRLLVYVPFMRMLMVRRLYLTTEDTATIHPVMKATIVASLVAGFALNLFWFSKIVRGIVKIVKAGKTHED